ncbi:MAG: ABC transporter permease [Phycisphaerae bacterium]|nr:ABC transporter permease [Phycisphaerae bacterium]
MPDWILGIRNRAPRPAALALGLVPIAMLLGLWWLVTRGPAEERAISPTILPSPAEVVRSIPDLLRRDLFHHALASLRRIGIGYLLALAVVLPVGIGMGSFGVLRAGLSPLTTASGYIPIATLVPLTLSWFGTGELQRVMFLCMAFGIYLLPLVVSAVEAVPDVYVRTAYTLGASRAQVVHRILIPIALPDIWHAMRLAFGVGWTYLVLTEVVVLESGLGYLIQVSFRRGPREHIYLVIVLVTLIAWVADLVWDRVGRLLFRYRGTP